MKVIVYQSSSPGPERCLIEVVKRVAPGAQATRCTAIPELADRLRRARYDVVLTVLSAASREELLDLVSLDDLLRGLRLVLVLPDGEPDLVATALTLYPRYLSHGGGDFANLTAVLEKMLKPAALG